LEERVGLLGLEFSACAEEAEEMSVQSVLETSSEKAEEGDSVAVEDN
jgi:hypothetical protein